jgi:hypothetical protein
MKDLKPLAIDFFTPFRSIAVCAAICACALYAVLLFSCASISGNNDLVPLRPDQPIGIMGKGMVPVEKLDAFLLLNNSTLDHEFTRNLVNFYIEEAVAEGVNHDIAFAQMCLETGFLRYGGLVKPEWHNFCGLGAIGPEQPGLVFPDPRTGVRAHIQHLQAYASDGPLNQALVDPRYRYVKRGSSPSIDGLAGTWAADTRYSEKIAGILKRLYDFSFS